MDKRIINKPKEFKYTTAGLSSYMQLIDKTHDISFHVPKDTPIDPRKIKITYSFIKTKK